jgi:hypothetical protein
MIDGVPEELPMAKQVDASGELNQPEPGRAHETPVADPSLIIRASRQLRPPLLVMTEIADLASVSATAVHDMADGHEMPVKT